MIGKISQNSKRNLCAIFRLLIMYCNTNTLLDVETQNKYNTVYNLDIFITKKAFCLTSIRLNIILLTSSIFRSIGISLNKRHVLLYN